MTEGLPFTIRREVPAVAGNIEAVALEIRDALTHFCNRADAFASELILREALANAARHGCGLDPQRLICLLARIRRNGFVLVIRDSGLGFDWRKQMQHSADDGDESGRGLGIFFGYATRVRFNESGNRLTLVRRFSVGKKIND